MVKIYRLHDHNRKFLMELCSLENCRKNAEALYGSSNLGIIDGYSEDDCQIINVEIIKENNSPLH